MKTDGFIFNLGHGVFPDVNPETLKKLTAFVHEYSAAKKRNNLPEQIVGYK